MMMSGFLSGKAYLDPQKSFMKNRKIAFLTGLINTFLIS
jgi:hypothetical protein